MMLRNGHPTTSICRQCRMLQQSATAYSLLHAFVEEKLFGFHHLLHHMFVASTQLQKRGGLRGEAGIRQFTIPATPTSLGEQPL